ncbi:hypothetical protein T310_9235, partial [Rasamsonia emersonii CBS 393.64]
ISERRSEEHVCRLTEQSNRTERRQCLVFCLAEERMQSTQSTSKERIGCSSNQRASLLPEYQWQGRKRKERTAKHARPEEMQRKKEREVFTREEREKERERER